MWLWGVCGECVGSVSGCGECEAEGSLWGVCGCGESDAHSRVRQRDGCHGHINGHKGGASVATEWSAPGAMVPLLACDEIDEIDETGAMVSLLAWRRVVENREAGAMSSSRGLGIAVAEP